MVGALTVHPSPKRPFSPCPNCTLPGHSSIFSIMQLRPVSSAAHRAQHRPGGGAHRHAGLLARPQGGQSGSGGVVHLEVISQPRYPLGQDSGNARYQWPGAGRRPHLVLAFPPVRDTSQAAAMTTVGHVKNTPMPAARPSQADDALRQSVESFYTDPLQSCYRPCTLPPA